jgi:hypothetical protein
VWSATLYTYLATKRVYPSAPPPHPAGQSYCLSSPDSFLTSVSSTPDSEVAYETSGVHGHTCASNCCIQNQPKWIAARRKQGVITLISRGTYNDPPSCIQLYTMWHS